MRLKNFINKKETTLLQKSDLKQIRGGEYGDVDWEFWRRYFSGTLTAHEVGGKVGSVIANSIS